MIQEQSIGEIIGMTFSLHRDGDIWIGQFEKYVGERNSKRGRTVAAGKLLSVVLSVSEGINEISGSQRGLSMRIAITYHVREWPFSIHGPME
jgi:hypothetical protein